MTYKILVAEDNRFAAQQYKMVLEKMGHRVFLTSNGRDCVSTYTYDAKALKLANENPFALPYQMVLLDHDMPYMKGSEAAIEILKINPTQRIVFLSAYGKQILQGFSKENIAIPQIIQKPFTLKFLQKFVEGRVLGEGVSGMYG